MMRPFLYPSWGITVLRVVIGAVFLAHGWQKAFVMGHAQVAGFLSRLGIPVPEVAAVLLIATELFGGAALLLGLFTRWAAIPLAFAMLVAIVTVHLKNGFFAPGGYEYPLTMLASTVALALNGSGELACDRFVNTSGPSPITTNPAMRTS